MPNLMLISLTIRNDHVFQHSHNSLAEPGGKRWDVRHISLFGCQNNIGMGRTCWRTIVVNSYTQPRVLSQRHSYTEARYVHLTLLPWVLGCEGELSNSAFGTSDSRGRDAWCFIFLWSVKLLEIYCYYREKSVSSLKSSWLDTGYGMAELLLDPCCCALKAFLDFKKSSDLILKSNWWNTSAGSAVCTYVQNVLYAQFHLIKLIWAS